VVKHVQRGRRLLEGREDQPRRVFGAKLAVPRLERGGNVGSVLRLVTALLLLRDQTQLGAITDRDRQHLGQNGGETGSHSTTDFCASPARAVRTHSWGELFGDRRNVNFQTT